MTSRAKEELVRFLEEKAFLPVLRARADGRSDAETRKLQHVQDATRSEIERFRGYASAREVVVNFQRDLSSEPAKRIHRELESLGLPTINDVRDAFEQRARDLGVEG